MLDSVWPDMSETPSDTPEEVWEELERRVAAFEAAWHRGERPQVADHLAQVSPLDDRLILELVHTELELRIKAGEAATASHYLERWPELAGLPGAADSLHAAEHRLRQRIDACRDTLLQSGDSIAPSPYGSAGGDVRSETGYGDENLPALPGYRFLREVGRGGMGIVYEAIDLTLDRIVAIKTDRYDSNLKERSRLRREAESAARLQHPNVAQVFQVVEHAGRVYVVSEFLPGGTLADRIAAHPLAAKAAAALLEPLAEAVAYAHARGVIHRDLKPANVLFSADGTPKVADFGLAKLLSDNDDSTRTGLFSGSPAYMSPEQAAGRRDVGPETDIWSLGIILYELLTGRPPFRTPTVIETLDQLRTVDPVSPRTLVPTLPRDLETVCLKCLEKAPAGRYATALSLASDLRHFLKGEPVAARPIGRIERARRWTLRNRSVAVLLLLLVASLAGGATAVAVYAARAASNAALARHRLEEAAGLRNDAARLAKESARHAAESARHKQEAHTLTFVADLRRAGDAVAEGMPTEAAEILGNYDAEGAASHAFAFHYLNRSARAPTQLIDTFQADHPEKKAVWFVRLSPDRKTLAACGANGEIRFYETATWQKRGVIAAGQSEVNGLAFTSDGQRLASAGDDGSVVLWDLATRMPIWKATVFEKLAFEVAFGLEESLIAVCGRDNDIHLLDAATGRPVGMLTGHTDWVQSLAVTPDGTTLFSASEDHTGRAWNLADRTRLWKTSIAVNARMTDIAVSDDGQRVAFAAVNTALSLNDVETGKQLHKGGIGGTRWDRSHSGSFRSIGFLPGSRDLVIAIESATLARARLIAGGGVTVSDDPRPVYTTPRPRPRTRSFVARTDDVVLASDDGAIELISFRQDLPWKAIPFKGAWAFAWVAGSGGRSQIAVASDEGQILVDPDSGKKRKLAARKSSHVAASADGRHVLFSRADGSLDAYDLSGEIPKPAWSIDIETLLQELFDVDLDDAYEIAAMPFAGTRQDVRYSVKVVFRLRDGDTSRQGLVNLDAQTGEMLAHRLDDGLDVAVAVSPDGRALAACLRHGYVQFLDGTVLEERRRFRVHHDSVSAVAVCPQTGLFAAADHGLKISVWDGEVKLREWPEGTGRCDVLEFSPDGRTLIACGRNRSPKLWDVATGRLLLRLDGKPSTLPNRRANVAHYSPDGGRIAVSGEKHLLIFEGRPPIDSPPNPQADAALPENASRS